MGRFATGVTVLTTAVDGEYHGMTANAVCSVSLEPLLVLVCVEKTAFMHGVLLQSGRFALNILAQDQASLARVFAAPGPPEEGQLRGVPFTLSAAGLPLLADSVAYLQAEVAESYAGGDHTIFLARVLDGAVTTDARPVLFYRGGYWCVDNECD